MAIRRRFRFRRRLPVQAVVVEPSGDRPRTFFSPATLAATRTALDTDADMRSRWQTAITQFEGSNGPFKITQSDTQELDAWTPIFASVLAAVRADGSDHGLTFGQPRSYYVTRLKATVQAWIDRSESFNQCVGGAAAVYDLLYDDLDPTEQLSYNDYIVGTSAGGYAQLSWDDQSATSHISQVIRDLAADDHETRYPLALAATQQWCDARTFTAYNSLGYEWKDSYPANTGQILCMWLLQRYGGLSDADTIDYYVYHLQHAAQLLRQMTIPHPGTLNPVTLKTNQVDYASTLYQLGGVASHLLWAFHYLPGRTNLSGTSDPRGLVTDTFADQELTANTESDLLSYLKAYGDEWNLFATTGNNKPLNFAPGASFGYHNSPGVHVIATFPVWLIENVQLPSASKTGEEAGIPLVRRWWPGTLDLTTIASSHTIKNSSRFIGTYWHKHYFCGNYEGNCHHNGSWQLHRAGPLYGVGGTDSHSIVTRRQSNHVNGTFSFVDPDELDEFEHVNYDDADTGGIRLSPSAQSRAEVLASVTNDFGPVTAWYADESVVAITSNLKRSYNCDDVQHGAASVNQRKLAGFTKEWVCIRENADGVDRQSVIVYDRILLLDAKFEPRLHLKPCVDPDIDGTESEHLPHGPEDQSVTNVDWEADGPTRWDYASPTRVIFDNTVEPALGSGPTGTITALGNGKVITKILLPTSIKIYKRGGANADLLDQPTHTYNGAPWFSNTGAWIFGEGGWATSSFRNNLLSRRAYVGPWTIDVAPVTAALDHRYLYVTDVMAGTETIDESVYAELSCDSNSVAARCGARAVVFAKETTGHSSGNVVVPSGVTFVVIVNLPAGQSRTLTPGAGLSVSAHSSVSQTGVMTATVSGAGTLSFS